MLTDAQKRVLLRVARSSVAAEVTHQPPEPLRIDIELPDASGVFVTIRRGGQLRGCLGTLECRRGLAEEVARCAADSAAEDPRFPPVSEEELPELDVEVSVLGPLEAIAPDPSQVVVGRHGLVAEQGNRRGLLLPQVATEWDWTPEQFLRQTCLKAGLAGEAWRSGARMYRFEAEVFGG